MSDTPPRKRRRKPLTPEQRAKYQAAARARYARDAEYRERTKERARDYYRANPKPYCERAARRRALKAHPEERREIRWRYAMRAHVSALVGLPVVVDHRYPVHLGGGHRAANLGWGSARWNGAKRTRPLHELPPDLQHYVLVTVPDPDGRPRDERVYIHPTETQP